MPSPRNAALDLTKGFCVLAMVFHHAINYFPRAGLDIRYFHFVSGAFPFLAGYVATHAFGRAPADAAGDRAKGARMLGRGLRLLVLCGLLNALLAAVLHDAAKVRLLPLGGFARSLLWSGDYNDISFSLLVPIGYVLAVLGVLRFAGLSRPLPLAVLTGAALGFCCWQAASGEPGYYLAYVAIGLLGGLAGCAGEESTAAWCDRWWLAAGAYLAVMVVIAFLRQPFPIYTVNVAATLYLLMAASRRLPAGAWASGQLLLWGRYSLMLYLLQIALLVVLRRVFPASVSDVAGIVFAIAATSLLQTIACVVLDRVRRAAPPVDRAYRFVFA